VENFGSEALKLWTREKIVIAELRCGATFILKVRKCDLQVAELRLRTPKQVAHAHLCILDDILYFNYFLGFLNIFGGSSLKIGVG
jgi:hypothetical protein